MSSTRTVRPTDLVALATFDGHVYVNEARTWERLGREPETPRLLGSAVEQWFSFATGRHTWISIQGQTIRGLVSARRRGPGVPGWPAPAMRRPAQTAWEIDCLIAASDEEEVALSLFDRLSAGAVRARVHKLFLRLEAGSDLIVPARKAGFVPYALERLLRLDGPFAAAPALPQDVFLRPRERTDEHALFQLYNRVAPPDVRKVEAQTLGEWQAAMERRSRGRGAADLVAERDGRVVAWLRTARGGGAARLDLVIAPEVWSVTEPLAAWAIRDIGAVRPLYATVPDYATPVSDRLLTGGFAPAGEYALLAKRLAHLVSAGRPVRATVKPAATV